MAPRGRRDFVLYTHGTYSRQHLAFYSKLGSKKVTVAVDGGLRFFKLTGRTPDILIGDFDSIAKPKNLPESVEVIEYPSAKDKTDTHLAVELAIERGAKSIDIVMPSMGEPDHLFGTVLLPFLRSAGKVKLRIVNHRFEICPMMNNSLTISDGDGDRVSIVPLSERGSLTCTGVEFPVRNARLQLGDTLALRNSIVSKRARFEVRGKALLVRVYDNGK